MPGVKLEGECAELHEKLSSAKAKLDAERSELYGQLRDIVAENQEREKAVRDKIKALNAKIAPIDQLDNNAVKVGRLKGSLQASVLKDLRSQVSEVLNGDV